MPTDAEIEAAAKALERWDGDTNGGKYSVAAEAALIAAERVREPSRLDSAIAEMKAWADEQEANDEARTPADKVATGTTPDRGFAGKKEARTQPEYPDATPALERFLDEPETGQPLTHRETHYTQANKTNPTYPATEPETGQPSTYTHASMRAAYRRGKRTAIARIVALIEGKRVDDVAQTLDEHLARVSHNKAIAQILTAIQEDTDE